MKYIVIITLLELGADPKAKDGIGRMAIDYAKSSVYAKMKYSEALKRLEEAIR